MKLVVIGGGTGLSSMLAGMKRIKDAQITAIVTVADNGGSTGRLRDVYDVPAIGDIRNVLVSMAGDSQNKLFSELINYRFEGDQDVGGHNLGNLIILALINITGSFMGAVQAASKVMRVDGNILPSTLEQVTLEAAMTDGEVVTGEAEIPKAGKRIDHVFYNKDIAAYEPALEAIREADLIIYGIGSLYTSIIPNLIVGGISDAIKSNPCPHIYFCNAMTQPGETTGMCMEDHVRALEKHSYEGAADVVVLDTTYVPQDVYDRYKTEGSVSVRSKETEHGYKVIERQMIMIDQNGMIRHDSQAVKDVVEEIMNNEV